MEWKTAPICQSGYLGKRALLHSARSPGRNMKTKKRFMNLEIRKPLVKAQAGLQVCGG